MVRRRDLARDERFEAGQALLHGDDLAERIGFLQNAAGIDDLQQMFRSIELASAVCDDPESARLMLDVLRDSAEDVLQGAELPSEAPDALDEPGAKEEFALSLEELHGRFALLAPAIARMANLERDEFGGQHFGSHDCP